MISEGHILLLLAGQMKEPTKCVCVCVLAELQ